VARFVKSLPGRGLETLRGSTAVEESTRDQAQGRLKRIAGQVAGIQRMVDDDRYCVDVLLQITAVQAALMETGRVILAGHVETCLTRALRSRDREERRKKIDELMNVFTRFCRVDSVSDDAGG
jgi:DNA-binding FrmR family transcriptional regulator